jgi:hypothetical protein
MVTPSGQNLEPRRGVGVAWGANDSHRLTLLGPLPKLDVAGSTPVARSFFSPPIKHLRRHLPPLLDGLFAGAGNADAR